MSALLIARCEKLVDPTKPDVSMWADFFSLVPYNMSMVDRFNTVKMPYNFQLSDSCIVPKVSDTFSMSYGDCCMDRAMQLLALSNRLNKPITILYSGGIDSTTVVISFLKLLGATEFRKICKIALSTDSIKENENFYHRHIRPLNCIVPSEDISTMLDGKTILVDGEHNDQLFGSDIIGSIFKWGLWDEIHQPYTRKSITHTFKYIGKKTMEKTSEKWFDLLDYHIKINNAPVISNADFWWWVNFSFKWQSVNFRTLTRLDRGGQSRIDQNYINENFYHFYSSDNFQRWTLTTSPKERLYDNNYKTYKWAAKKFIYDFNEDKDYFHNKVKMGSLYKLFVQKKSAEAITSNFEFIQTEHFNASDYYNPSNTFKEIT